VPPHYQQTHTPLRRCPCTPQLLCASNATGDFNQFCDMPRHPANTYSMHGGAGGIMSIGLMRRLSLDFMERCTKSIYSTGGGSTAQRGRSAAWPAC
jgi:hypothetical protein